MSQNHKLSISAFFPAYNDAGTIFFNYRRLIQVARDLIKLWWRLVICREHMKV